MSKNSKHYKGSIGSFKILTHSNFAFLVSAMLLDTAGKELSIARIAGVKQLAELSTPELDICVHGDAYFPFVNGCCHHW